ncbi:hypothetical protein N7532_002560 [Penicillium argentinense]|uniref:Integral membrane protein, Mpv17/PMP22 family n=1 Tax=Penicillium argentinense TaxID=1131581 RepID=A0A9W9G0L1_9EURO|nr:uncharacterized protein N7532_002560 [Penicillium argentinense]KAJ5109915.1 hypothetical protein N7532_002560 [Penicillium argentinense]
MSIPPIAKATLQTAVINAGSNVLAQCIKAYRNETPFILDPGAVTQFTTCALIVSPLGYLWLENLEAWFPGKSEAKAKPRDKTCAKPAEKDGEASFKVRNTIAKIIIDQVVGGAWNTVLFITVMGMLRGLDMQDIQSQILQDFWPIMIAGFKLWPFVSILNFTVVPPSQRLLVGSLFGVIWGIYLSLVSG